MPEKFEVGQQVLVTRYSYYREHEIPWEPGEIVKIGPTLVHIKVRNQVMKFRIQGQYSPDALHWSFRTLAQHEAKGRAEKALNVLQGYGLEPVGGRSNLKLSADALEALVAVLTAQEKEEG